MYTCVLGVSIWPLSIITYWIFRQYRFFFKFHYLNPLILVLRKTLNVHNESRPEYS